MEIQKWKARIEEEREQKEGFFASNSQSPIPPEDRSDFSKSGLEYYPPNPDFRFELEFHEHEEKDSVEVETTKGETQEYLRWGEFRFEVNGEQCELQAYKSNPEEERLWVPFRDGTSGEETYSAGRYLDLEPERHQSSDEKWILDLNKAYNPWCAYSEAYNCPLIPPENWLDVRIESGEKNYSLEE